ncbi:NAD(P)/FAD-dependent oxidoreductase, partial [Pseudomonas sp. YuFO8]
MENTYDVAIIGSGIAGTMLGAILAKEGVSVVIIDAGTHPRFAVGESMVPESAVLLKILANRYAIPELAYPGELNSLIKHVGSSSAGIKLAFSFAWNGKHQE